MKYYEKFRLIRNATFPIFFDLNSRFFKNKSKKLL